MQTPTRPLDAFALCHSGPPVASWIAVSRWRLGACDLGHSCAFSSGVYGEMHHFHNEFCVHAHRIMPMDDIDAIPEHLIEALGASHHSRQNLSFCATAIEQRLNPGGRNHGPSPHGAGRTRLPRREMPCGIADVRTPDTRKPPGSARTRYLGKPSIARPASGRQRVSLHPPID